MPYVTKESQRDLHMVRASETTGELTYMMQQEIQEYLIHKLNGNADHKLHYADVAEVLGALEGMKADVVRRLLTPLEERAQAANGDVWIPSVLEAAA